MTHPFGRGGAAILALSSVAWLATAHSACLGGEGLDRVAKLLGREPANPPTNASTMPWRSIPRPAREAARGLAKSKDASVSRCVAIEKDDTVTYEIHASRRTGLFRRTDFVLTSVSEPKSVAEKRREEQTLRRRVARLRAAIRPEPAEDAGAGAGFPSKP